LLGMTVSPLIAPESSILTMIEKLYPEEPGEDTLTVRERAMTASNSMLTKPSDPIFWDLIEELDSGDLEKRLKGIEQSLEQIWTLLERILRSVEARDREAVARDKQ